MSFYRSIHPEFWTGTTGIALRGDYEAQTLALYLVTNSHSHLCGAYRLPLLYIESDIGMGSAAAIRTMQRLEKAGFSIYDHQTNYVFVYKMFEYQSGNLQNATPNGKKDSRIVSAINAYAKLPEGLVKHAFFEKYGITLNVDPPSTPRLRPVDNPSTTEAVTETEAVTVFCASTMLGQIENTAYVKATTESSQAQSSDEHSVDCEVAQTPKRVQHDGGDEASEAFNQFWEKYPNKKGKARALEYWNKQRLDSKLDHILAHIEHSKLNDAEWLPDFRGKTYIPHGSTYVNERRFMDYTPPAARARFAAIAVGDAYQHWFITPAGDLYPSYTPSDRADLRISPDKKLYENFGLNGGNEVEYTGAPIDLDAAWHRYQAKLKKNQHANASMGLDLDTYVA